MSKLPDLQNQNDSRGIAIDRVGITNYKFPIKLYTKSGEIISVSANTHLFVGLPHDYKGVNMSRFAECLLAYKDEVITVNNFSNLLNSLKERLKSDDAYVRFEFDYFITKITPVTQIQAPQAYKCAFTGVEKNGDYKFILEVNVIAASVCPCSREMSLLENLINEEVHTCHIDPGFSVGVRYVVDNPTALPENISKQVGMGAHNQRSLIRVQLSLIPGKDILIEDLVTMIEAAASAPTYPILKRPDEKFVTEQGYNNAKFSEDILRDLQLLIENTLDVESWALKVSNEESIHPYNATSYQHSPNWKF